MKTCLDCDKQLGDNRATRCRQCANKQRRKPPNTCMDCGKVLNNYNSKRCHPCWGKSTRGKPKSSEHRTKISEALTGRKIGPPSEEHRRKISEALKGYKHSEATKRKWSEAARKREQERIRKAIETNVVSGRYLPVGTVRKHGRYIEEKVAHGQGQRNWKAEHRVIMEKHLGRPLKRTEHIHHLNRDTYDNRLDNLVLISDKDHRKLNTILYFVNNCDDRIAKVILDTLLARYPHLID